MLVFLSCGSVAFADLACQWKDHFTDNRSAWRLAEDASGKVAIQEGKLCLTSKQNGAWALMGLNVDRSRDFQVAAQITPAANLGQAGYGLVWELTDPANYSVFLVTRTGGWGVMAMRNGKSQTLKPLTAMSYLNTDGSGDVLAVTRLGDTLTFFVNGKQVGTLPAWGGGPYLGLIITGAGDITSDYISVSAPPVYQGETLSLPAGALAMFVETLGMSKSPWPIGDLGGITGARRGDIGYILTHANRNAVDIVTRRVELDTSHDFFLEASISKTSGADDMPYGLAFNRNGNDRWMFSVMPNGQYSIYKVEGGKPAAVQDWTSNPNVNKYESSNTLSVWRSGDSLSFGINGRLAYRMPYAAWTPSAELGFLVGGEMSVAVTRLAAWRVPPAKGAVSGDCLNGWGIGILDAGAWYIGSWKAGVPQGVGTKYWPDGRIEEGTWDRGAFTRGKAPEAGQRFYPVKLGDSWEYADATGRIVLDPLEASLLEKAWTSPGFIGVPELGPNKTVITGFKDAAGKDYWSPKWSVATAPFSEGLLMVTATEGPSADGQPLKGFVDDKGKVVIEPGRYTLLPGAAQFDYGLCPFNDIATGLYGFIGRDGTVIVAPRWQYMELFSEGLCAVKNDNDMYGYVERTGRMRIEPRFKTAQAFREGLAYVEEQNGTREFIDPTGAIAFTTSFALTDVLNFHAAVQFSQGRVPFMDEASHTWGYLDAKGKVAVKAAYTEARSFSEGLAAVNRGGTWDQSGALPRLVDGWGFVDANGREVIPCTIAEVGDFSNGLAPARTFDMWGFIDTKGAWAIKPIYQSVEPFGPDGLARIHVEDGVMWIDRQGKLMKLTYPPTN